MNTQILQKCLDELKKDSPSIPYVQGMLETFISLAGNPPLSNNVVIPKTPENIIPPPAILGEEDIPAYLRAGPIGNLTER